MISGSADQHRIAITGIGPVTALGTGADALWEGMLREQSAVRPFQVRLDDEDWLEFPLAGVDGFDWRSIIRRKGVERHLESHDVTDDRDLHYLLAIVQLALDDSGLSYDPTSNDVGIVLTHENPGVGHLVSEVISTTLALLDRPPQGRSKQGLVEDLYGRFRKKFYNLQTFMYLYHVSWCFRLHGMSLFINNACASGLYAIESAAQLIRDGKASAVIVAGADDPRFPTKYLWFRELGLYAEDGVMRPFDASRNGFVFGEGGAALVLEDWDRARRRGARIYGEYLGGGFNQDAWKVSLPDLTYNGCALALKEGLHRCGLRVADVDLINPHGASTRASDRCEAEAIASIFGEWPDHPPVTAFKPYVGHNLGGSALLESVMLLLCLQNGVVPATLNTTQPDPELRVRPTARSERRDLRVGVKLSTGFAGFNAAAFFRGTSDTAEKGTS